MILKHCDEVEYAFKLQDDLHNVYRCSYDWHMFFITSNCKCLHFGPENVYFYYFWRGLGLIDNIENQKDREVTNFNHSDQIIEYLNVLKIQTGLLIQFKNFK